MTPSEKKSAPILDHATAEPSVFVPENLLERAARMRGQQSAAIPSCCLLDFDGELVPVARDRFGAMPCSDWPCFHTSLQVIERDGFAMGLIGGTVGAPFAVLVAEQLIASGCRKIIGYSSAGAVSLELKPPCLIVPDRAVRDEGTSYHYLPPEFEVHAEGRLPEVLARRAEEIGIPVQRGATWTTDAPYRETASQIERHRREGVLTVEMEAAALMALAKVRVCEVASLLHVTNAMATTEDDFNKGPADIHERVIACCFAAFRDLFPDHEAVS